MNSKKIFWGVFMMAIGALLILNQLDLIHFTWRDVWRLWPAVLIVIGISILPVDGWIKLVGMLGVMTIAILLNPYMDRGGRWNDRRFDFYERNDYQGVQREYNVPFDSTCLLAKFSVKVGAGTFRIQDTTAQLVEVDQSGRSIPYTLMTESTDSLTEVKIKSPEQRLDRRVNNKLGIKLNNQPVWDMDFEVGAGDVVFDLSAYKVRSFDLSCGASDVDIKFGSLVPELDVDIETGVSSLKLKVPNESGCRVVYDGALTDKHFSGFTKTGKGTYETANFNTATKKILIQIESGVASIGIERY